MKKKLVLVTKPRNLVISYREKITKTVNKYPGLRFHQIKMHTNIANGTLQYHLSKLTKSKTIQVNHQKYIPRYYSNDIEDHTQIILLRLRQNTPSKIIKSLLKNECQSFGQMTRFTQKSPGTVSIYKNMLLEDNIIIGNTDTCECSKNITDVKIKYRLTDPDKIRLLIKEYGKSSLKRSVDNLADIFLSL